MIEFQNYSFRYEESTDLTLENINLTIEGGEFILLTGRSGCGKTTLLRALNGLVPHFYPGESSGNLRIDGKSLLETKPSELAGKIGTVFQDPRSQFFITDTTRELAFGCENMGFSREETIQRVAKATEDLGLLPYLNRSIFSLSSGEKQQVAIGSVHALSPKVYIFDEPSANLDHDAIKRLSVIMKKLKNAGFTILVAEHKFFYLRDLIDHTYLIENGRVAEAFTRDKFCSLDEKTRTTYGLRTTYPEQEAKHFRYESRNKHQENSHLEANGISFAYKRETEILYNLSFHADAGDVVGILGHNGAGKTTLLSILTGILKENSGSIRYNGEKLSPRARRNLSCLVMQDADYQLFTGSVEEELSLGAGKRCTEKVNETLDALGLSEYRERHPASLSGGQKQRVTIGTAITKANPIVCFDEPTSGLDYDSMIRVSTLIKSLSNAGVIIFVVSHDFEFIVRTCTQILQLDQDKAVNNRKLTPDTLYWLSEQYFN